MSAVLPEREAVPAVVRGRAWQWPLTCFAIALLVLGIAFRDTWWNMVNVWLNSDAFGHAFLVPPIAGWLIWHGRQRLRAVMPRPWLPGLGAVAVLVGVWYLAHAIGIALGEQFAAVGLISALALTLFGWRAAWVLAFPLGYLFFMVPFGEGLVWPLQQFTADFAVWWLRLIGIPVYRDGIFLHLPTGSFEVAEACSGLRYLIAMVVLGVLFAGITYRQWWRRAAFMALCFIVPVIANGFRALGIVLVAYWSDHRIAVGVDHILYGWLFLTAVMLILLWLGLQMREKQKGTVPRDRIGEAARPAEADTPVAALATATLVSVALIVAGPAHAAWRAGASFDDRGTGHVEIPAHLGTFAQTGQPADGWRAAFTGADAEALGTFRSTEGEVVDLYVAIYHRQRQGAEVINATNSLAPRSDGEPGATPGGPRWMRVGDYPLTLAIGGRSLTVAAVRLRSVSGRYRLALPLYLVNDTVVHRPTTAKLYQVLAELSGQRAAAAIVAAAPYDDDPAIAAEALRALLAGWPDLRAAIAAAGGTD